MARKKKILSFPPQNRYSVIYLSLKFQLQCSIKKKKTDFHFLFLCYYPEEIKLHSVKSCMGCKKKLQ